MGWRYMVNCLPGSAAVIAFFGARGYKFVQLRRDLNEGLKLELDVQVLSIAADEKKEEYSMVVRDGKGQSRKIMLTKEQAAQTAAGQQLTIDVYKNSLKLLSSHLVK